MRLSGSLHHDLSLRRREHGLAVRIGGILVDAPLDLADGNGLIRPYIGHAAASPSAQIVCP